MFKEYNKLLLVGTMCDWLFYTRDYIWFVVFETWPFYRRPPQLWVMDNLELLTYINLCVSTGTLEIIKTYSASIGNVVKTKHHRTQCVSTFFYWISRVNVMLLCSRFLFCFSLFPPYCTDMFIVGNRRIANVMSHI